MPKVFEHRESERKNTIELELPFIGYLKDVRSHPAFEADSGFL